MFNNERIQKLEIEVRDLRSVVNELLNRIRSVENDCEPVRINEPNQRIYIHPGWIDPRPKVTLNRAVSLICEHLKLRFTHSKALPEKIGLEKVK